MKKIIAVLLTICLLLPVLPVFAADMTSFEPIKVNVINTSATGGKSWAIRTDNFPFEVTEENQLAGCTLNGTVTYTGTGDFSKTVIFDKVPILKSEVRREGEVVVIRFKVPEGYTMELSNQEDKNYKYDVTINPKDGGTSAPEATKPKEPEKEEAPTSDGKMSFNENEELIILKAEDFGKNPGTWTVCEPTLKSTLSVIQGLKKKETEYKNSDIAVDVKKDGTYYVWARGLDYEANNPGTRHFAVAVNGTEMPTKGGTHKTEGWAWQKLGEISLSAGEIKITLIDSSRFYARCEAVALTTDKNFAPPGNDELSDAVSKYNPATKISESKAPENKLAEAVILFIGNSKAYVLGEESAIDKENKDVVPFIENGRTLVPVRFISESFGATVGWDDSTRTVSVDASGKKISMVLGESKMTVDGKEVILDAPANSYNGRTFIPLRAMVEAIGKKVFWDARGLILISDVTFNETADKTIIDNAVASFGGEVLDFAVSDEDLSDFQGTIGENDYRLDYFHESELKERDGIANVVNKMKNGKKVTVGFLGGSITMQQNSRRVKIMEWLKAQYPSADFTEIDVSLSGTDADLAACRTDGEILAHNPDLVFVEYAVNGGTQQNMEGIIRKIWKKDNTTDIIFVYTTQTKNLDSYANGVLPAIAKDFEAVADYYGVPSVAFGFQIAELRDKGMLTPKASEPESGKILFSTDGTHPTMDGSVLYAGAVARSIATMEKHTSADSLNHELKAPLHEDNWENAKMFDLSVATFNGDWTEMKSTGSGYGESYPHKGGMLKTFSTIFPKLIGTKTPGSSVTIKFTGTTAGFMELSGRYACQLKVSVDGGEPFILSRHSSYNSRVRHQYYFLDELPYGEHTVTFTLDSEKPDKSSMKDYSEYKAEYGNSEFYISNILVVGDIK